MKLHQALADLARDHGHDLFRDATAFRGSFSAALRKRPIAEKYCGGVDRNRLPHP